MSTVDDEADANANADDSEGDTDAGYDYDDIYYSITNLRKMRGKES